MRNLEGHDGTVTSVAFSPDGLMLASVASRGPALFWDLAAASAPRAYPDPNSSVVLDGLTRIAWSQKPGIVALGGDRGDVYVFAADAGKSVAKIDNNIVAPVTGLAFFNNGRYLVICCGGADDGAGAIYIADRDKEYRRSAGSMSGTSFGAAAATPHGKVCYYVDSRRRVFRWDLTSPDQRRTNNFVKPIRALSLSPDGAVFAATDDYAIQLYDANTMQRLRTLTGHQGRVDALAFSPDGRFLASGSWDKTVRFWDYHSGREIAAHDWNVGQVRALAISPDGLVGAAAGDRGTIVLWDIDL